LKRPNREVLLNHKGCVCEGEAMVVGGSSAVRGYFWLQ